jgi:beta-xylosidase
MRIIGVAILSVGIVGVLVATHSTSTAALPTSSVTWIDNFDSSSPNSRWSWVREDPTHWNLTSNPGFLHILAQPGGLFQTGNDTRNLLFTAAPSGAYQITTKVTISPTENFQNAAIYVYQDDDNYLRLSRRYADGDKVDFRREVSGTVTTLSVNEFATVVYLRIAREGDSYMAYYSTDGSSWISVGQRSMPLLNPKVGIGSECGPSTTEIPTDFDFFQLDDYTHYLFLPLVVKQ